MDDYIKRSDAIEALHKAHSPYPRRRFISVEAIKNVPAADVRPEWIPVTELLPEKSGRYLVVLKRYGFVDDIKLNDEQIRILRYHDGWRLPYHVPEWINETLKQEVTHWMPLPEPPKEET